MSPSGRGGSRLAPTPSADEPPDLGVRRLLTESVPLAAVVAFWGVLATPAGGGLEGTALRAGAVAMGGAYALVRGWQVAVGHDAGALPRSPRSLVRASVTPAIACVAWIAAGWVLEALVMGLWHGAASTALPPRVEFLLSGVLDLGAFVGALTGVLVVVLYAAAFARTHVGAGASRANRAEPTTATSGDD
jgi:hypothetical protein